MYVRHQLGRLCVGLCLLALASVQVAHAQTTVDRSAFDRFMGVVVGNNTTVGYGAGGVPLATSAGTLGSGYQPLGSMQTGINGGALEAKGVATLNLPNGRTAALSVASAVNKPSIGGALLNFAKKTLYPLSVGLAVFDLARELGFTLSKDGSGALVVQQDNPSCSGSTCYDYGARTASNSNYSAPNPGTGWKPSRQAACDASAASASAWAPSGAPHTCVLVPNGAPITLTSGYYGSIRDKNGAEYYVTGFGDQISTTQTAVISASEQSLADAIAAKSGWPTSSALAPAVKQAVESGESIKLETPTVTGPLTVAGPNSSTVSGNTTTTKNETYNLTYNTNNVSYNTVVTTTVNDGTNTTTTTETKDQDKQLDQCEKYPDSAGCSLLGTPTSDTLNKKTQAVAVVAATFASSSVCPSPLSFSVRSLSYSFSYQPLCDRLALLKVLFLAIAGVVAAYILADSFRVQ